MGRIATLIGWKTSSSLFIFLKNNWDGAQADLPVDCVTFYNSVRLCINYLWHLKSRPAIRHVSFWNSFPLCSELLVHSLVWRSTSLKRYSWEWRARLSLHLKHSRSGKSSTGTKPSYCLNTFSSYLISSISTRQGFRGTHCCYFILLFSYLVCVCFKLATILTMDSQRGSGRNKQIQLNLCPKPQLILEPSMFLGRRGGGGEAGGEGKSNTRKPPAVIDLVNSVHSAATYGGCRAHRAPHPCETTAVPLATKLVTRDIRVISRWLIL